MEAKLESIEIQILLGQNFTNQSILIEPNSTLWPIPNRSIPEMVFYGTLFLFLESVGNFLLFYMVIYEKYGMDSQKRTVTNQLLSGVCVSIIFNNIFLMPFFMVSKTFGVQSKNSLSFYSNQIGNCYLPIFCVFYKVATK